MSQRPRENPVGGLHVDAILHAEVASNTRGSASTCAWACSATPTLWCEPGTELCTITVTLGAELLASINIAYKECAASPRNVLHQLHSEGPPPLALHNGGLDVLGAHVDRHQGRERSLAPSTATSAIADLPERVVALDDRWVDGAGVHPAVRGASRPRGHTELAPRLRGQVGDRMCCRCSEGSTRCGKGCLLGVVLASPSSGACSEAMASSSASPAARGTAIASWSKSRYSPTSGTGARITRREDGQVEQPAMSHQVFSGPPQSM